MNQAVGLLVALPIEARAILGVGIWKRADGNRYRLIHLKTGMSLIAVLSGVGQKNSMMSARWLLSRNVCALLSLGVAGGLDPTLRPGDIVFGDLVYQEQGDHYQRVWEGVSGKGDAVLDTFQKRGIRGCKGSILSVKKPALTAEGKKKYRRETGALAADMETGSAALAASESAVPFFAFRAICDPAGRDVREPFFHCLDSGGQIRVSRIIPALLRNPSLISDLLALRKDFQLALTGLHDAWHKAIREMIPLLISKGDG